MGRYLYVITWVHRHDGRSQKLRVVAVHTNERKARQEFNDVALFPNGAIKVQLRRYVLDPPQNRKKTRPLTGRQRYLKFQRDEARQALREMAGDILQGRTLIEQCQPNKDLRSPRA